MFATQLLAQEERQGNIYVFETFLFFFLGVLPFFFFFNCGTKLETVSRVDVNGCRSARVGACIHKRCIRGG